MIDNEGGRDAITSFIAKWIVEHQTTVRVWYPFDEPFENWLDIPDVSSYHSVLI